MARRDLKGIDCFVVRAGLFPIVVQRERGGWHYDGPSSYGPRRVRQHPGGVCWQGPITQAFAAELLQRVEAKGLSVEVRYV